MNAPLPPGARIGILGGGQLGRMSAMAAARLGYLCHVYAPEADSPGMLVAAKRTVAAYDDVPALRRFAASIDVATFEFENVPAATLDALAPLVPCRPGVTALRICQDRLQEKRFLAAAGVPVAPWHAVESEADLAAGLAAIGLPAVLKTTRLGYDGRGQAMLRTAEDAAAAFGQLAPKPLILEAFVPFIAELSAIVVRAADGTSATFDPTENRHEHHILDLSFAPARIPAEVAARAREYAVAAAAGLDLIGVLALEYFLLPDGQLLGNEMAPRPHNSGHWTMDACLCSQFDQHIRAIAGLPLGSTERHNDVVMKNLVGPAAMTRWPELLSLPDVVPHLYGKQDARPGRKMGHINRLLPLGRLAAGDEATCLRGL